MPDLFDDPRQPLAEGAVLLRGYALPGVDALWQDILHVTTQMPPRQGYTPGGRAMSARLTCCGALGWVSDRFGYRYEARDPETGRPWPLMPASFLALARAAAAEAGFAHFTPDACLINRYAPGARMSLHQDRNEADFSQPIVSVSLGLPAIFEFGGMERSDRPLLCPLEHGDVVVWGGPARLRFHGIRPVAPGIHPMTGEARFNLTFRRAR